MGVAFFCGGVIITEALNGPAWRTTELESFSAVGQWSNLGIVMLVMLAAVIRKILGEDKATNPVIEMQELEEGGENLHEAEALNVSDSNVKNEEEGEDWDWRVGYAS